jgi:hypothetical protein
VQQIASAIGKTPAFNGAPTQGGITCACGSNAKLRETTHWTPTRNIEQAIREFVGGLASSTTPGTTGAAGKAGRPGSAYGAAGAGSSYATGGSGGSHGSASSPAGGAAAAGAAGTAGGHGTTGHGAGGTGHGAGGEPKTIVSPNFATT